MKVAKNDYITISYRSLGLLVLGVAVIFTALFIFFHKFEHSFQLESHKVKNNSSSGVVNNRPTITPIPKMLVSVTLPPGTIQSWVKYTNDTHFYSFEIPSNWQVKIWRTNYDGKGWKDGSFMASYSIAGELYQFYHCIEGNAGRDILGEYHDLGELVVDGVSFHISSYSKDGVRYLLRAVAKNFDIYGAYELLIPPNNTDYYTNIFYQIINSFSIQLEPVIMKSFQDDVLGIKFNYPSNLGQATSHEGMKSSVIGESWHQITFGKRTFSNSYFEVSASTDKYKPMSWEGTSHWLNTKISVDESAESVKDKLESSWFRPINVQRVKNKNNILGFKAYVLNCYGPCMLERIFIIPLNKNKYNNLMLITILGSMYAEPITNEPYPIDKTKQLANEDISKIEDGTANKNDNNIKDMHDLIFNSIVINN